ncbi:small ribosomal subunit Rsm22 family protein [Nitrospira sp. Nam80]
MRRLSEAILTVLSEAIGLDVRDQGIAVPGVLVQDVLELSRRFTRERRKAPMPYMEDRQLAAAYLAYFFPVNVAKVQELLEELAPVVECGQDGVVRVLELGCGPGTGVMGILDWAWSTGLLESRGLECVALDRSKHALSTCTELWASYTHRVLQPIRQKATLLTMCRDVQHGLGSEVQYLAGSGGYDLIIMQNTLSELFVMKESERIKARVGLVAEAMSMLSYRGTLMLIEPALRDASRELHEVRDRLLETMHCTLYSPCLHEGPCPALMKPTDWCHEERAWIPPDWIRAIDRKAGFIKDALKFSYALLRKDGRTVVERNPDLYRIVSELRVMKGEKRAWLCSAQGRPEVGRLDRLTSPQNAAVNGWHRGAIVRISEIVRKEREGRVSTVGRIEGDTAVQIVRSV